MLYDNMWCLAQLVLIAPDRRRDPDGHGPRRAGADSAFGALGVGVGEHRQPQLGRLDRQRRRDPVRRVPVDDGRLHPLRRQPSGTDRIDRIHRHRPRNRHLLLPRRGRGRRRQSERALEPGDRDDHRTGPERVPGRGPDDRGPHRPERRGSGRGVQIGRRGRGDAHHPEGVRRPRLDRDEADRRHLHRQRRPSRVTARPGHDHLAVCGQLERRQRPLGVHQLRHDVLDCRPRAQRGRDAQVPRARRRGNGGGERRERPRDPRGDMDAGVGLQRRTAFGVGRGPRPGRPAPGPGGAVVCAGVVAARRGAHDPSADRQRPCDGRLGRRAQHAADLESGQRDVRGRALWREPLLLWPHPSARRPHARGRRQRRRGHRDQGRDALRLADQHLVEGGGHERDPLVSDGDGDGRRPCVRLRRRQHRRPGPAVLAVVLQGGVAELAAVDL